MFRVPQLIKRTLAATLLVGLVACTAVPATVDEPEPGPLVALSSSAVPVATPAVLEPTRVPTAAAPAPTLAPTATTAPTNAGPPTTPTPISATTRQQIFNEVWAIVNEHYLYDDFGGVDWATVRDDFEPRIAVAATDAAFYELLGFMVGRLGDDHSRFLPPQAAQREDTLSSGREEQVGIGVIALPMGDGLLIQHVFPDSPAQRAGLLPRDRIVAIDGVFYTASDIQGPEGTSVRLTVVRPGEGSLDIVLTRRRVEGRITPLARRLPGEIGYLSVTTLWVSDMDRQVAEALHELTASGPLRGMVLDLRSNPGGWRNVLTGILSHFVRGEVGNFTSRKGDTALVISAPTSPDLRGLPLVVLIDSGTASYAELLAAILQSHAGAVIVGAPSPGNTETIYSYEITGGGRLWVAQEGFSLKNGIELEGIGVQPDITVLDDWTRFSERDDPGLTTALRLLAPGAGGK
ncbi:MAG: S41 family peptidase [Oscillochloridaceae bacterium umkhey_bin13]